MNDVISSMGDALSEYYANIIPFVRSEIRKLFPASYKHTWLQETLGASRHPRNTDVLQRYFQDPNNLYLQREGKALRSVMAAMTLEAFGENPRDYGGMLAMIEVIEDTTIAWDDIWDASEQRRGGSTMHVGYGVPNALNASIAAYDMSFGLFFNNKKDLEEKILNRVMHALTHDMLHLPMGQAEELYWTKYHVDHVTEAQYLQETMSRCAFLSFRGPVKIPSILAGKSDGCINSMAKYGEYLGLAYHLHGDNLNLRSDDLGKIWAEDITTGRRTMLILHTLRVASRKDRQRLAFILDSKSDDPDVKQEAVHYLKRYKSLEYCEKAALDLGDKANDCLESAGLKGIHKSRFVDLTRYCCSQRTH